MFQFTVSEQAFYKEKGFDNQVRTHSEQCRIIPIDLRTQNEHLATPRSTAGPSAHSCEIARAVSARQVREPTQTSCSFFSSLPGSLCVAHPLPALQTR